MLTIMETIERNAVIHNAPFSIKLTERAILVEFHGRPYENPTYCGQLAYALRCGGFPFAASAVDSQMKRTENHCSAVVILLDMLVPADV